MNNNFLEKDITELFGLAEASEEERVAFIDDVSKLILESMATRMMADMNDVRQKEFEAFVSEKVQQEDFIDALVESYPKARQILDEEIAAFKAEAIAVLGKNEDRT